jgi:putative lipoprotein
MTRRSLSSLAIVFAGLACSSLASAADPDPWWGRDKGLHFGASVGIASGGYAIGAATLDARYEALILGGALSIALGTGKELADMAGLGSPSWRDFTWDLVGTVAGLGLAWGLDLALRGTSAEHPALAPGSKTHALQGGWAIRF